MSQRFDILAISSSVVQNNFNSSTKLFSISI